MQKIMILLFVLCLVTCVSAHDNNTIHNIKTKTIWNIDSNLTISADIILEMPPGAKIHIGDTKTLTINGSFEAGPYQVFSWSGSGRVVFGPNSIREAYPEWWGAAGDGSTNDFNAIQACLNAIPAGCTVHLGAANYYTSTSCNKGLVMPQVHGVTLKGKGMGLTKIICDRTGTNEPAGFYCDYKTIGTLYGLTFRDLTIQGSGKNNPYALVYFPQTSRYTTYDVLFEKVELTKAAAFGVRGRGSWTGHRTVVRDCKFHLIGASLAHRTYGSAFLIQFGDYLRFEKNTFDDLFQESLASGTCNWFAISTGLHNYVNVEGNYFIGDNARMGIGGGRKVSINHFRFTNNFSHRVYFHEFRRMTNFVIQGNTFEKCNWTTLGVPSPGASPGAVSGIYSDNVHYGHYDGSAKLTYCFQLLGHSEDITIANNRFSNLKTTAERIIIGDSKGIPPEDIVFQDNYLESNAYKTLELIHGNNIKLLYNTVISTKGFPLIIHSTMGSGLEIVGNIIRGKNGSVVIGSGIHPNVQNNIFSPPPVYQSTR